MTSDECWYEGDDYVQSLTQGEDEDFLSNHMFAPLLGPDEAERGAAGRPSKRDQRMMEIVKLLS